MLKYFLISFNAFNARLALVTAVCTCLDHERVMSKITPSTFIESLAVTIFIPTLTVGLAIKCLLKTHTSVLLSLIFSPDCFIHLIITDRDSSILSMTSPKFELVLKMNVSSANANKSSKSNKGETNIA